MLKAIAFDLWETLITNTPEQTREHSRLRRERLERILAERGFGATAQQIEVAYRLSWHRCQELYWGSDRDIPCRTQIDHFLEASCHVDYVGQFRRSCHLIHPFVVSFHFRSFCPERRF